MSGRVPLGQVALRLLCEGFRAPTNHANHKRQVVKKMIKGLLSGVGTVLRTWETWGAAH
jgi:hypothetical protein